MSAETNNVTVHEEAKMCTLKERIGHAIGVLGHDSMYTMWSTYITPFLTDILQIPAGVVCLPFCWQSGVSSMVLTIL